MAQQVPSMLVSVYHYSWQHLEPYSLGAPHYSASNLEPQDVGHSSHSCSYWQASFLFDKLSVILLPITNFLFTVEAKDVWMAQWDGWSSSEGHCHFFWSIQRIQFPWGPCWVCYLGCPWAWGAHQSAWMEDPCSTTIISIHVVDSWWN